MKLTNLSHLRALEAEAIHIFREVVAQFENPVLLYSVGKDSSVLVHLARKAFYPGRIPFPLMHVDTGFKFDEMITFRDRFVASIGAELIVHRGVGASLEATNPFSLGTQRCCAQLKTQALLEGLREYRFDAAIGGARRDEEKSRAKERIYSFRDAHGQWDPKNQRPELWDVYNGRINPGESIRVFPLSNWTELDVWHYIHREKIEVVPLYFARKRQVIVQGDQLIPLENKAWLPADAEIKELLCRFRTLGCSPCTGAVRSSAKTVHEIMEEMMVTRTSERATRVIDHDSEGSMEKKKQEGYF